DVLSRYFGAAKENDLDVVVRITSDCPLIDPAVVDNVIGAYLENAKSCDYVSNCLKRTFPRGMDTEVFPLSLLEQVCCEALEQPYREHVTLYIHEDSQRFCLLNVAFERDESHQRWTVDTPEDFKLIEHILETLYPINPYFEIEDVLALMKVQPNWFKINSQIEQKKFR
ncbi:MAG: acylneuraminate cytidylyltransferase, partial [Desulfosporosinus sp.]